MNQEKHEEAGYGELEQRFASAYEDLVEARRERLEYTGKVFTVTSTLHWLMKQEAEREAAFEHLAKAVIEKYGWDQQ